MHAQSISDQALIEKIHTLPPEKVSEVLDFVEFLAQKQSEQDDRQLAQAATRLSQNAFATVWNNSEDSVYERETEHLPFWATATTETWTRAFEEWINSHPQRAPLTDSAFERASFYEGRP